MPEGLFIIGAPAQPYIPEICCVPAFSRALVGICGAFVLARGLRSLLYGVGAADPVSYAGAAAVMAMSVVLACALPAWRAARVDPTVALRREG